MEKFGNREEKKGNHCFFTVLHDLWLLENKQTNFQAVRQSLCLTCHSVFIIFVVFCYMYVCMIITTKIL